MSAMMAPNYGSRFGALTEVSSTRRGATPDGDYGSLVADDLPVTPAMRPSTTPYFYPARLDLSPALPHVASAPPDQTTFFTPPPRNESLYMASPPTTWPRATVRHESHVAPYSGQFLNYGEEQGALRYEWRGMHEAYERQAHEKHVQPREPSRRRHVCPVCDKRFNRPSSLSTHMSVHTGAKPYQCQRDGCGRCFSTHDTGVTRVSHQATPPAQPYAPHVQRDSPPMMAATYLPLPGGPLGYPQQPSFADHGLGLGSTAPRSYALDNTSHDTRRDLHAPIEHSSRPFRSLMLSSV